MYRVSLRERPRHITGPLVLIERKHCSFMTHPHLQPFTAVAYGNLEKHCLVVMSGCLFPSGAFTIYTPLRGIPVNLCGTYRQQ